MTFSQSVKEELCSLKLHCEQCSFSFIYAVLLFWHKDSTILFKNDKRKTVEFLAEIIVELTGVIAQPISEKINGKDTNKNYTLKVEGDEEDKKLFDNTFRVPFEDVVKLGKLKKSCAKIAFVRGAFLACGTIVNPKKEYHFEFKLSDEDLANKLYEVVLSLGFNFKLTRRKTNYIIYLKESEQIEEMLTCMGAVKNALNIMNIKIEKELRNNVNRIINCETANIEKTVNASVKQVKDIEYIIKQKGELSIPEDLRDVAKVRMENPDMSLRELCEVFGNSLSKSGLNHRLKRLSKLAQDIKQQNDNENENGK